MKLTLNVGVILTLGNQVFDKYDFIPLVFDALDDRRQRGRGVFCAVVGAKPTKAGCRGTHCKFLKFSVNYQQNVDKQAKKMV